MLWLVSCAVGGKGYRSAMTDRSRFTIIPIGGLHTGQTLWVDGVIRRSSPSMIPLAAAAGSLSPSGGAATSKAFTTPHRAEDGALASF